MNIEFCTIKGSPYIGVFGFANDEIVLIPKGTPKKEIDIIEKTLEVKAIETTIASSSLIGVFVAGNSRGFLLPEIAEDSEMRHLEGLGLKVKRIGGYTALGNLIAANDKFALISPMVDAATAREIGKFLGVEESIGRVAGTDIPGSCLAVTNKGFVVHPNIASREFKMLIERFGVKSGVASTENFGDPFIRNSILANSKAAVVGSYTSGHELMRIDEGLSGR